MDVAALQTLTEVHNGGEMSLNYRWRVDEYGNWSSLYDLDLSQISETGVYLIGYWSQKWGNIVTVDVGQGNIAEGLGVHRNDPSIAEYIYFGPVVITWTCPPAKFLDGIERFLADALRPVTNRNYPRALPIEINLPMNWTPGW